MGLFEEEKERINDDSDEVIISFLELFCGECCVREENYGLINLMFDEEEVELE